EFGTRLSPDPRIGATPGAAEAPTSTFGPFRDAFGRPALIDVFGIAARIPIQRSGAAEPFLYVELPPPTGSGSALTLGAGSIWIPAAALAQGVPASAFVGLRIKGGTVGFGTTVALGVSPIIVPATATVTLDLILDPPPPATGSGPGADARGAHVQTPARVTFTFTAAGGALSSADDAAFGAFGTDLTLKREALPAHYDPVFGRVDFPYAADRPDFAVAVSHSTLATFAGTAPIFGAAWSLPVSITDAGSLGAASGAGGVAIGLSPDLKVQWTGREGPAHCSSCVLLVEPGLLAVGGFGARATNVAQPLELYSSSLLRLATPTAFPFRFTSEAIGQESWAFLPQLVATLDRPRTVNSARTRLAGPAFVLLLQNAAQTLIIVEAVAAQPEQAAIQSYCLKNLLLKANGPRSLLAVATLSGDAVGDGGVALQFDLRLVLPILPDPYATNLAFDPRRAIDVGVIGNMTVLTRWRAEVATTIDLLLPTGALSGVVAALPSAAAATPSPAREVSFALSQDGIALAQLQALFDQTVPGGTAGPTLLDLSTNVSQFGVSFGTPSAAGAAPAGFDIAVADLFLQAPAFDVRVVTLPAVQWEPVLTPDLATRMLSYANSGNTTLLAANSVTLVPIAPRPAIDALLAAYHATPPSAVAARFTLPFGIAAVAELRRSRVV
ncbi:MAG TPA: hypothetical protein VF007_01480, partial [Stellaceae bacterium]